MPLKIKNKERIDTKPSVTQRSKALMAPVDIISRFVRLLMIDGKKTIAYKSFSAASAQFLNSIEGGSVKVRSGNQLVQHLKVALDNVKPVLECRKCRVAGVSRQVPAVVPERRGTTLAIRWIIEFARKRRKKGGAHFAQCLAQELVNAHGKQGGPRQRRDQFLQLSSGNRGYLRYRWW